MAIIKFLSLFPFLIIVNCCTPSFRRLKETRRDGNGEYSQHNHSLTHVKESIYEKKAEEYYQNQIKARKFYEKFTDKDESFMHMALLDDDFPCMYGTIPLGGLEDGHKFTCAIHHIHHHPIVYSFGCHGDVKFEQELLEARHDALVHVIEIDSQYIPTDTTPGITFHHMGLGYAEDRAKNINPNITFKSLNEIMNMLGHDHIDILKMDIEGYEWEFVMNEAYILKDVGQFLVELHNDYDTNPAIYKFQEWKTSSTKFKPDRYRNTSVFNWIEQIEKYGMRLFHKELNFRALCCIELSFVQLHFQSFNEKYAVMKQAL